MLSLHDRDIAPVTFQGGHKQTTIYSFFLFLNQGRYGLQEVNLIDWPKFDKTA